jgi:tRNA(Ile)-lysidine synthase
LIPALELGSTDPSMTETPPFVLERRVEEAWPTELWRDSHVVLAVSSGPDSVAMLRAVLALKRTCGGRGRVTVAHFNHALRGPAADADQAWVETLCRHLEVPLAVGRAEPVPPPARHSESPVATTRRRQSEADARAARYQFLRETAERLGARFVAVAHTADDQVETILHRIVRGTGLKGLAGISAIRPLSPSVSLVRPLLAVSREGVLDYLSEIDQDYRVDASNADTRFTRNRLRHALLPLLREQYNPAVNDALLRLSGQARESQHVIADHAETLARSCVTVERRLPGTRDSAFASLRIDCRPLVDAPPLVVREVCRIAWQQADWPLQAMGSGAWQQLAELALGARQSPLNLPGNIRAQRDGDSLVLEFVK